jgi:hypothetical protein
MTDTEKKLVETLQLALFALNRIPNRSVDHEKFRNSYDIAAEIERVLREVGQPYTPHNQ